MSEQSYVKLCHELTVSVVIYTKPILDRAPYYFFMHRRAIHEAPPLTEGLCVWLVGPSLRDCVWLVGAEERDIIFFSCPCFNALSYL